MIPGTILLSAKTLWSTWWRALLGALIATGVCLPLGYCEGRKAGEASVNAEVSADAVRELDRGVSSGAVAAVEKLQDDVRTAQEKEKRDDAINAAQAGAAPSAASNALNCQRLRNAGRDVSHVPACGGR